jgi:hypothetical protein
LKWLRHDEGAYLPIDGEAGWKPAPRPEIALNNRQPADANLVAIARFPDSRSRIVHAR